MSSKKIIGITQLILTVLLMLPFHSSAVEVFIQAHNVDQSGANGLSIGIENNLFEQRKFNWAVNYHRLKRININWNGEDVDFILNTVDLMLSYRYYPKYYNRLLKNMMVEFQVGFGVAVTENKLVWPDLNEEKYFSEQGDVNGNFTFLVHKKLTRKTTMHIGVKHYPDYSEFGNVSTAFLGFSYRFGRQAY